MGCIWIAEENAQVAQVMELLLKRGGHTTFQITARTKFPEQAPQILIVNPSGFGMSMLNRVRSIAPEVKVLVVSGRATPTELAELGTDGALTKPFNNSDLLATVAKLLPTNPDDSETD